MRSSTTPDLALHPHEHEHLLSDQDESFNDDEFAVVVDDAGSEDAVPCRLTSPTLAEQIQECLIILREAQAGIPELQKPRVSRQYIYTVLFASLVTAAVVAPATLLGTLFHQLFPTNDDLLQDANARLAKLHGEIAVIENKMQDLHTGIQPQWAGMFAIWKPYFERWYTLDENDRNCEFTNGDPARMLENVRNYVSSYFCHDLANYESGDWHVYSQACYDIAREGCDQFEAHPEFSVPITQYQANIDALYHQRQPLYDESWRQERRIRNGFPGEGAADLASIGMVAGVAAAAVVVGLIAGWRYYVSRTNYKDDLRNTHKINACMTDAKDANKLINLLVKLDIKMNQDTTVEQLISELETRAAEIELRAKCRGTFLLSANMSRVHHGFFKPDSLHVNNKDVANIIFEKAGLGNTAYRK